jgi:hypothetical protein
VIVSSGPLAAEEPDPFASPTASATPEATATATSTPEPVATETPTAEVPTATTTPDPGTPEASPVPYSDDFEAGSDGWSAEGAVIAAGEGTAGSTGVVLASSGTDQVAGAPSYIQRPLGDNVTTIYASADVRIDAIDANGARLLTAVDETGAAVASLYALADGTIAIRWADAAEVAVVAQLPVGGWQRIEAAVTVVSGTVSVSMWLDGAGVWSGSAPATATSISTVIFGGWTTDRSYRIAVDNVALDVTCTGQCGESVPTATPAPTESVNTEEPGTPPAG